MSWPLRTLPYPYHEAREVDPTRRTVGALEIPARTPDSIREGDRGAHAHAVQRALQKVGRPVVADGAFGPLTKEAVTVWQRSVGLFPDGIFGPASSAGMARKLIAKQLGTTPDGLLRSIVAGESGNLIAAVNWSTGGGVDCGYTQRRLYDEDFGDRDDIERTFDSNYQLGLLRSRLVSNYSLFLARPAVHSKERAWRLATLNHNYPSGADRLSRTEERHLSSYWTTPQSWVISIGAQYPDGWPLRTPLEWCRHYSLGDPDHSEPGFMVRQVTSWSV